ncbi:pickpocket protein 28 [Lucilia cuprina]|uniref:pickpocket protein 28 n=1 Tax=Lucilia cuprina TaxID=7375 RepID=UPI001F054E94|nr:pickpocket protein 28 [Lucilia cuprina]
MESKSNKIEIHKPKSKLLPLHTYFKENMKRFLIETSLNGLKYIIDMHRNVWERGYYLISFSTVFTAGLYMAIYFLQKWQNTPVIISMSSKATSIQDVPFPAVTFCNMNQALDSRVNDIEPDTPAYAMLQKICFQRYNYSRYKNYKPRFKGDNLVRFILKNTQSCSDMIIYCKYGPNEETCTDLFREILLDEGICCVFNQLHPFYLLYRNFSEDNLLMPAVDNHFNAIDWTPEKGYPKERPSHYYPRVSGGTGTRMGLTVILNVSSEEYYCSKSKCVGFKILVHNPAEQPKISNYGFLMTTGREARIPIEPVYQDAVSSIRSIRTSVRRCLFSDEGDLEYFQTYSRKNCELECEARILMQKCSCVLYYLPRFNPDVPICGPNNNFCTNKVQTEIESSNKSVSCDSCLPGCFELNYHTTLTASSMIFGNFKTSDDFPPEIFNASDNISDLSIMHFYYTSNIFRSTTKSEMFGFTEFLSNTGGLLGLFMGFSIFSIIEIVYYITVRPYCAARTVELEKKRKQQEAKWLMRNSFGNDGSSYNIKKKSWFKKSKKSNRKYKNNLRNILMKHSILQKDDVQVYPYLE